LNSLILIDGTHILIHTVLSFATTSLGEVICIDWKDKAYQLGDKGII